MMKRNRLCLLLAVCCLACDKSPTAPDVSGIPIDRLMIFVRDWPDEYVEIDVKRSEGKTTLVMFRPPQPGVPRILIDSIGPDDEDPEEIVELLNTFDIWAMADSNAAGAACSTKTGQWACKITWNDYSVVMGVTRGGQTRAQRYTGLGANGSNARARALGDFVLAMMRKRVNPKVI